MLQRRRRDLGFVQHRDRGIQVDRRRASKSRNDHLFEGAGVGRLVRHRGGVQHRGCGQKYKQQCSVQHRRISIVVEIQLSLERDSYRNFLFLRRH